MSLDRYRAGLYTVSGAYAVTCGGYAVEAGVNRHECIAQGAFALYDYH